MSYEFVFPGLFFYLVAQEGKYLAQLLPLSDYLWSLSWHLFS